MPATVKHVKDKVFIESLSMSTIFKITLQGVEEKCQITLEPHQNLSKALKSNELKDN